MLLEVLVMEGGVKVGGDIGGWFVCGGVIIIVFF